MEYTRELMISTALKKSFMNPQTVGVSQNLDQLMN
ncbi:aspartyl-phosphate phosphatase Spo0E family protein [Bacillus rhizoplanae]